MKTRERRGFTLIELLVVIAIIAVLIDVADRTSPVIGGSIFLKRRVRPENGGNRLDEPQVRPRTSPTTQEWGRKAAQSAQIRSL